METYMIQVSFGNLWEDLYIKARTPEAAIKKAIKQFKASHKIASDYIKAVA